MTGESSKTTKPSVMSAALSRIAYPLVIPVKGDPNRYGSESHTGKGSCELIERIKINTIITHIEPIAIISRGGSFAG